MNISLVLTVIGRDKPGIVEALSKVIAGCEANWEESRMARLASRFAGILRVRVPAHRADELSRNLESLSSQGLRIVAERDEAEDSNRPERSFRLDLLGNDHPGIVRDIARVLAERGVNIEELSTECVSAPMAGTDLFKATALLRVPAAIGVEELRRVLEALANDMMVDINLGESEGKRPAAV